MHNIKKIVSFVSIAIIIVIVVIAANQFFLLRHAHNSFANYYAFRGCSTLLKKESTYGLCKLPSGQTIKIVLFKGRWYLDGDLPICIANLCF